MKNFLFTIFKYLLLPALILAYPLDLIISSLIKNETTFADGEISIWNDIYNGKINTEILILGSSRAWKHINPMILEKKINKSAYNIGSDGNHFILQYFRYKKYLQNNLPPKIVIHSIECGTLVRNEELFNDNQYLPYMLFDSQMKNMTRGIIGFENFQYYIPFARYYGKKNVITRPLVNITMNTFQDRVKGYMGQDSHWDVKNIKKKTVKKTTLIIDKEYLIQYENFIKDCLKRKILLILVYSPEFKLGQNHIKNRDKFIQIYKQLSRKYNILFFDYSDNFICFKRNYFFNNSHLNRNGADLFSQVLARDIKKYIDN